MIKPGRIRRGLIEGFRRSRWAVSGRRMLVMVICGIALSGIPTPVHAQPDLTLEGDGAFGWTVSGLMPGQSGSQEVTVRNTGDAPGQVFIWISDIESTEGLNPEPETDTTEPGELLENLLFSISSTHPDFSTDLTLPTTLDNFPTEGEGIPFIMINPLDAGEAAAITWQWELPYETGNEAQGDELSFNIYYAVVDLSDGTTTTFTSRSCQCRVSILDENYQVRIDCCNSTIAGTRIFLDPEEIHFLEITRGTALICGDCLECGNYPRWIVMSTAGSPPPPPEGMVPIGPAYEIIGYYDDEMENPCPGVIFGKPVALLLDYDPDDLPEDTTAVLVSYFDEDLNEWVGLPPDTGFVAEVGKATAMVNHLSLFGIFASSGPAEIATEPSPEPETITPSPPPQTQTDFRLSNLTIYPQREVVSLGRHFVFMVKSGADVTVTADVYNDGSQEGNYSAQVDVDGITRTTSDVTVRPGASQEIKFILTSNESGRHVLQIGELADEFETTVWINWWLIGGLAGVLALLISLAWYFNRRRRH